MPSKHWSAGSQHNCRFQIFINQLRSSLMRKLHMRYTYFFAWKKGAKKWSIFLQNAIGLQGRDIFIIHNSTEKFLSFELKPLGHGGMNFQKYVVFCLEKNAVKWSKYWQYDIGLQGRNLFTIHNSKEKFVFCELKQLGRGWVDESLVLKTLHSPLVVIAKGTFPSSRQCCRAKGCTL